MYACYYQSELYDFYAIEPHEWKSPARFCVANIGANTAEKITTYTRDVPMLGLALFTQRSMS